MLTTEYKIKEAEMYLPSINEVYGEFTEVPIGKEIHTLPYGGVSEKIESCNYVAVFKKSKRENEELYWKFHSFKY